MGRKRSVSSSRGARRTTRRDQRRASAGTDIESGVTAATDSRWAKLRRNLKGIPRGTTLLSVSGVLNVILAALLLSVGTARADAVHSRSAAALAQIPHASISSAGRPLCPICTRSCPPTRKKKCEPVAAPTAAAQFGCAKEHDVLRSFLARRHRMPETAWSDDDAVNSAIVDIGKLYNVSDRVVQDLPRANLVRLAQIDSFSPTRQLLLVHNVLVDGAATTESAIRNAAITYLHELGVDDGKAATYLQDLDRDAFDRLAKRTTWMVPSARAALKTADVGAAVAPAVSALLAAETAADASESADAAATRLSVPATGESKAAEAAAVGVAKHAAAAE